MIQRNKNRYGTLTLEAVVETHSAVFVDTSFLQHHGYRGELGRELFSCSAAHNLSALTQPLLDLHHTHLRRLQKVVHPHVFAVPEVLEELGKFCNHLSAILGYQRQAQEQAARKTGYVATRHISDEKLLVKQRRSNDQLVAVSRLYEENGAPEEAEALRLINCLVQDVQRLTANLQEYHGKCTPVPRQSQFSETDHRIVEAALGYVSAQRKPAAILTNDADLPQILRQARAASPILRDTSSSLRLFRATGKESIEQWYNC